MKELSEPLFRAFFRRVQKLGYTDLKNMTQRLETLVTDMQPQESELEQESENELEVRPCAARLIFTSSFLSSFPGGALR